MAEPQTIYVVGWAQDVDEWGVIGAYTNPRDAAIVADRMRDDRHKAIREGHHNLAWHAHNRHRWQCCRPQIEATTLDP